MFFPLLPCGWLVSIFSSVVFIWQFLSWRPAQVTTSQQMKVEVKDGLAGSRSDIENRTVAVFNAAFARQLGRYQVQVADILGIFRLGTFDVHDVFFGNDEHVGGSLRPDVLERKRTLVFIDFFGRHIATNELAEKAGHFFSTQYSVLSTQF